MDPYSPDSATLPPAAPVAPAIAPAWEDPARPLVQRWWVTMRDVLVHPILFFEAMRPRGGVVAPLVFAVIGGAIPAIVSAFGCLTSLGVDADCPPAPESLAASVVRYVYGPAGGAAVLLLATVRFAALVCLEAGLVHGCLILFGGARRRFETTLRVVAYAAGATLPFLAVPALGSVAYAGWMTAVVMLGLTRAHGIDLGRAATATLVPLVLVGGCMLVPVLLFGTLPDVAGASLAPT